MTEKRFTLSEVFLLDKPCISDNGNDLRQEDVVALLNEQHEEIAYLEKKKCDYWNKYNQAYLDSINFKKENEQLKQQCKDFMEMLDDMCIAYFVNDGLEDILND